MLPTLRVPTFAHPNSIPERPSLPSMSRPCHPSLSLSPNQVSAQFSLSDRTRLLRSSTDPNLYYSCNDQNEFVLDLKSVSFMSGLRLRQDQPTLKNDIQRSPEKQTEKLPDLRIRKKAKVMPKPFVCLKPKPIFKTDTDVGKETITLRQKPIPKNLKPIRRPKDD